MVPYSKEVDNEAKHNLKQIGKNYVFIVKNLCPEDAGIYQVDVEGVNVFSTDFKSMFYIINKKLFLNNRISYQHISSLRHSLCVSICVV